MQWGVPAPSGNEVLFCCIAQTSNSFLQGDQRRANVYAVLRARADELQGFSGQPGVWETLLRNRLCILFLSGGRPKAHDANANACRRALANELQGFSENLNDW